MGEGDIRFPAPCWWCFSSVHPTNFLQGSGQRTGMATAEVWFCDQFCVFEVCVWIIVRLEDPNMAHYKIYNRVSHLFYFFYLMVFDRIRAVTVLDFSLPR